MALDYSTLTKPVNPQVVDPATGRMREEWQNYFDRLTTRLNAAVGALGADFAPVDPEYLVGAANAALSAERVVTDSTSITWDLTVAGQAKAKRAALTGDVTASADSNATTIAADAVTTAKIINDAVTYAKMQNVSATSRFLGRITAGAGDAEELTGTQATTLLDTFTSGLKGLVPASGGGTANFLRADGTFAAPSTTPSLTVIQTGSLSGSSAITITSIPATYRYLVLIWTGASFSADSRFPVVQFSTDNGSTYDTTVGNYVNVTNAVTSSGSNGVLAKNAQASAMVEAAVATKSDTFEARLVVFGYQGGANAVFESMLLVPGGASSPLGTAQGWYKGSTSAINAMKILISGSGTYDAGTYTLYGVS